MQSHSIRAGRRSRARFVAVVAAAVASALGQWGVAGAADPFAFTIDPTQSSLTVTVSGAFGSDSDSSPVVGTLAGALGLPAYPFSAARVTGMDAALQETLSFSPGSFIGRINATGTGIAFAIPGPQNKGVAGPAGAVALDGSFAQTGNLLEGRGVLTYAGTGIYSGVAGSRDLASEPPTPADFAGTLTQSGSTLRAAVPLDVTQTFEIQNGSTSVPVTVRTQGTIVATAATAASGWKVDADGAWASAGNWSNGVPNRDLSPVTDAVFGAVNTGPRTVSLAGSNGARPRRLYIASDQPYTFTAGTSSVGIFPGESIRASGATTHVIDAAVVTARALSIDVAGPTTLAIDRFTNDSAANTTKTGEGVLQFRKITYGASLVVGAGTVRLADPAAVTGSLVTGLKVDPGATFDLGGEALVVNYFTGPSPFADLVSAVKSGRAEGAWTGTGITSGAAAADPRTAVGVVEASDLFATSGGFYGASRDATSVLLLHTLAGDANLDRTVNFADLLALAKSYNRAGDWADGDSNYDGVVNFVDLLALAKNYNRAVPGEPIPGAAAGFEGDLAAAFARVPEPSVGVAAVAAGVVLGLGRRRRQSS